MACGNDISHSSDHIMIGGVVFLNTCNMERTVCFYFALSEGRRREERESERVLVCCVEEQGDIWKRNLWEEHKYLMSIYLVTCCMLMCIRNLLFQLADEFFSKFLVTQSNNGCDFIEKNAYQHFFPSAISSVVR